MNKLIVLLFFAFFILSCNITGTRLSSYPYIVIMFDDGRISVYEKAFPIMKKYGIVATNAIVTKNVGNPYCQSWKQICELENNYGWETASHTYDHPHLNLLSDDQFIFEMQKSSDDLKKHNLNPVTLAIPYGEMRPNQYPLAAKYYNFVRNSNDTHTKLPINSNALGCFTVHSDTELSEIYDRIFYAKMKNEPLLIILFHDVGNENSEYNYDEIKFEKLMKFLVENQFRTSTLRNAMAKLEYY